MCAGAIVHARVRRLVFGAWDARAGAAGSITNVFTLPGLNHRVDVFGGGLMHECARLLQEVFVPPREGLEPRGRRAPRRTPRRACAHPAPGAGERAAERVP